MVFQERTYGVLIVSVSSKFIEATRALLPPTDYYPVETAHSAGRVRRGALCWKAPLTLCSFRRRCGTNSAPALPPTFAKAPARACFCS